MNNLFELFMNERGAFLVVLTALIILTMGNLFYAIFRKLDGRDKEN